MTKPAAMVPETTAGVVGIIALGGALAALPLLVSGYYVEFGTTVLIAAMLALSLQLLVGCSGLLSLGHGAFYGLAAYTVYLITPSASGLPMWLTLAAAVLASGLAALLVGALSLRTQGFFFLMVTLAFGQMIFFVFHDTKIGGGTDGAYLARPVLSAFGAEWTVPRRDRPIVSYYLALLQLGLMYGGLALLLRTLFGRVLEGIRVNEHRMRALGFNVYRYKLAAFTLAGMLAGVAGHMWTVHRGFVNPELVGWHKSAEALLHIVLGGLGTLHGPILGAAGYAVLGEAAQQIASSTAIRDLPVPEVMRAALTAVLQRQKLLEGLVILLVVLAMPKGLSGLPDLWGRIARRFLAPRARRVKEAREHG